MSISLDNIKWKSEIRLFISKFRPENIRACPKKARSYIILSTIQVFFDVKYSCESQKSQKLGLFDYTLHYTLHKNVDISVVPAARLERVRSCLQGILSPWCLPFHHAGICFVAVQFSTFGGKCQAKAQFSSDYFTAFRSRSTFSVLYSICSDQRRRCSGSVP